MLAPPILLLVLPAALDLPLKHIIRSAPDIGWWLVIYMPAAFVLGAARTYHVMRLRR